MALSVVIFDLDDTLYPEEQFVRSGYKAVSRVAKDWLCIDCESIYCQLVDLGEKDRRYVFDRLLQKYSIWSEGRVEILLSVYRAHYPNIQLFDDVPHVCSWLRNQGFKIGIISDGYLVTQQNKIKALGLEEMVDHIICTDKWGRAYWKPHSGAFIAMLEYFEVNAEEACYIADNPRKDFLAPNKLGMKTIQIIRPGGFYTFERAPFGGDPQVRIRTLFDFTKLKEIAECGESWLLRQPELNMGCKSQ